MNQEMTERIAETEEMVSDAGMAGENPLLPGKREDSSHMVQRKRNSCVQAAHAAGGNAEQRAADRPDHCRELLRVCSFWLTDIVFSRCDLDPGRLL